MDGPADAEHGFWAWQVAGGPGQRAAHGLPKAIDLQVEGGWNSARTADRYYKVRPVDERRRAPSVFAVNDARHTAAAEKEWPLPASG